MVTDGPNKCEVVTSASDFSWKSVLCFDLLSSGRGNLGQMAGVPIVQGKGSLEIGRISVIGLELEFGKKLFEGLCFSRPIPLRPQIRGRPGRSGCPRRAIELAINLEKFLPKSANRSNSAIRRWINLCLHKSVGKSAQFPDSSYLGLCSQLSDLQQRPWKHARM